MAAIFKNKKTGCGCSDPNTEYFETEDSGTPSKVLSHQCCKTVDLDVVYDNMVIYNESNSPCEKCLGIGNYTIDCEYGGGGECIDCVANLTSENDESPSPYGYVFPEQEIPQCSKLVVFFNARINESLLEYDEIKVFKSRKRRSLPEITKDTITDKLICSGLPYCSAENLTRKCCCGPERVAVTPRHCSTFYENRGCVVLDYIDKFDAGNIPYLETDCVECSENNFQENIDGVGFVKKPIYNHWMMTPCYFNTNLWPDSLQISNIVKKNLMAYAPDNDQWWFLSSEEFNNIKNEIAEIDPFGKRKHTILLHCEVRSKPIYCCTRSRDQNYDGVSIGCNGSIGGFFFKNKTAGFCGAGATASFLDEFGERPHRYHRKYLTNQEDREQKVKIYGVVGFTATCGNFDFEKICNNKWDEGQEYGP